jgi:hypothetical protein
MNYADFVRNLTHLNIATMQAGKEIYTNAQDRFVEQALRLFTCYQRS